MRKGDSWRTICTGALAAGMTVQIALGLVWMLANFGTLQLFGDTAFQVAVSGSLRCDEHTGILYPALLLVVRALFRGSVVTWYRVMYVLQFLLAFCAADLLLRCFSFFEDHRLLRIWGSLALLTIPMCMQCILAVLPRSVACSFFLMELAFFFRGTCREEASLKAEDLRRAGERLAEVCLFWLLGALTENELFLLGAVPVAVSLLVWLRRVGGKSLIVAGKVILTAALFLGIILCIRSITQEKGLYRQPEKSPEKTLFDRTAWPVLLCDRWRWPESLLELVGRDVLAKTSESPENVNLVLEPALEEKLGTRQAQRLYLELAGEAFHEHKKQILGESLTDLAGYLMPPAVTGWLLTGRTGAGAAPRSYDVMKRHTPLLTKAYFDFGTFWFCAGLVLAGLWAVPGLRDLRHTKSRRLFLMTAAGCALICSVHNTLRGYGLYDYKAALWITVMWTVLTLLPLSPSDRKTGERRENDL